MLEDSSVYESDDDIADVGVNSSSDYRENVSAERADQNETVREVEEDNRELDTDHSDSNTESETESEESEEEEEIQFQAPLRRSNRLRKPVDRLNLTHCINFGLNKLQNSFQNLSWPFRKK